MHIQSEGTVMLLRLLWPDFTAFSWPKDPPAPPVGLLLQQNTVQNGNKYTQRKIIWVPFQGQKQNHTFSICIIWQLRIHLTQKENPLFIEALSIRTPCKMSFIVYVNYAVFFTFTKFYPYHHQRKNKKLKVQN